MPYYNGYRVERFALSQQVEVLKKRKIAYNKFPMCRSISSGIWSPASRLQGRPGCDVSAVKSRWLAQQG